MATAELQTALLGQKSPENVIESEVKSETNGSLHDSTVGSKPEQHDAKPQVNGGAKSDSPLANGHTSSDKKISESIVNNEAVLANQSLSINAKDVQPSTDKQSEVPNEQTEKAPASPQDADEDVDMIRPNDGETSPVLAAETEAKPDQKADDALPSVTGTEPEEGSSHPAESEGEASADVEMTIDKPIDEAKPVEESAAVADKETEASNKDASSEKQTDDTKSDIPAATGESTSPLESQEKAPDSEKTEDVKSTVEENDDTEIEFTQLSQDAPMEDAPPPPTKLAREREDDGVDEPSAKRARTEPREEEVIAATKSSLGLESIERWDDKELEAQPITSYQAREYRRVLAGVKKTKNGGHFKDAVIKLWPALTEPYLQKVEKPMDIGELERTLRDRPYETLSDFKQSLSLLYKNSEAFNGTHHNVTRAAYGVVETIWVKILPIPSFEPPKSKPAPKHQPSRHHEQRASTIQAATTAPVPQAPPKASPQPPPKPAAAAVPRRTSTGPGANSTDKAAESQTFAVPPGGVPQIRRSSTQTDGDRPKRAIQPPKSKDISYTTKGSMKKHQKPELQFCEEVLHEILDSKNEPYNIPFLAPVDAVALNIPTYYKVIKKPMDLGTMESKLANNEYSTAKQFYTDMEQMFRNCFKFNSPDSPVHRDGKELEAVFKREWAKKDQWIAKHAPIIKASSLGASSPRSDNDSDDDGDGVPAANDAAVLDETIMALQDKLQEETAKLNQLYLDANPNEIMIKLQSTVLATVQQSLLQEKAKQQQQQKQEKPAKPKPKPKPKGGAAGGGGAKKNNAAGAANKRGGGGGGSKRAKKTITEQDKTEIANAINDLEPPHIEQAISVIKRDTGQAENGDGELELDIDQLSHDALLKLWDLCVKSLPRFAARFSHAREASPDGNEAASKHAAKASKSKKNKPMSAEEQEARISRLNYIKEQFRGGSARRPNSPDNDGGLGPTTPQYDEESSEASDSEEE